MKAMPSTVLVTGGRAPVALEIARMLSLEGHIVYGAESLNPNLLSFSRGVVKNYKVPSPRFAFEDYKRTILEIIQKEKIEYLIPTCEEIYAIARIAPEIPKSCVVVSESFEKLDRLHNKLTFIETAQKHELLVPYTRYVSNLDQIPSLYNEGSRFVIKPVYSRFAQNVIMHTKGERLNDLEHGPWVLQEFIAGKAFCTYTIAREGKILAHTTYPSQYTWGRGATIYFESVLHPKIFQWVQSFVEKEKWTGQISFDFIQSHDGGVYPLECNPRATSGIHLLSNSAKISDALLLRDSITFASDKPQAAMLAVPMFLGTPYFLGRGIKDYFSTITRARDVLFSWRDPLPFFGQMIVGFVLFLKGLKVGVSATEASTYDIEYNGPIA